MGALQSACPNRKTQSRTPTVSKSAITEPAPRPVSNAHGVAKRSQTEPRSVPLPTKSWRALLEEPSLNPDAKPFTPSQVPPAALTPPERRNQLAAPPGLSKPGLLDEQHGDPEPEWMQYLTKKLHDQTSKPLPVAKEPPWKNQSKQPIELGGSISRRVGEGSNGGAVSIHTEAYLKLLKEGAAKKKAQPTSAVTKPPRATGKSSLASGLDLFMPMTTSTLVKKWSSAVVREAVIEDEKHVRTTQDDIRVERQLVDQDLSDPAYFSETELVNIQKASTHNMRRRPNLPSAMIRSYVMQDLNYSLDRNVAMLLYRLQRYTDQIKVFNTHPSSELQHRRFVIGLKEVSRRTKQSKLECLVVAPDIEPDANSGGLDDRMRELLAQAYENRIPVIFALSRARLGRALGKSLHISVLGVLDATGAQQLLVDSVRLANEARQAWLARLGNPSR